MESLPLDVLRYMVGFLGPSDKLNCSLVCTKLFVACIGRSTPASASLRVQVCACPCRAGVSTTETWLAVCQCRGHGSINMLQHVLPVLANAVRSLELEDELAHGHISDESLHALLAYCADAPLTRLSLSRCDLAQVRPWTLSLLAQFDKLQELSFDGCTLPVTEAVFIRSISTSFRTLTTLEVKDSRLVTDKLARSLSRNCPQLEKFCVSGCPAVSSFSALSLIETALTRKNPMLMMHVENTAFNADLLDRYMRLRCSMGVLTGDSAPLR